MPAGSQPPAGRERLLLSDPAPAPAPQGVRMPAPHPVLRRAPLVIGASLVAAVVVVGLVRLDGQRSEEDVLDVTGSVTVMIDGRQGDEAFVAALQRTVAAFAAGAACDGSNVAARYEDIVPGSRATVRDGSGSIVASGWLSKGWWVARGCRMPLVVRALPPAEHYVFAVDGRGERRYSRAELEESGFDVEIVVGR